MTFVDEAALKRKNECDVPLWLSKVQLIVTVSVNGIAKIKRIAKLEIFVGRFKLLKII